MTDPAEKIAREPLPMSSRAEFRAALAAHEAAVRESVAREIEADIVRPDDGSPNAFAMGEQHAARIARGGAS